MADDEQAATARVRLKRVLAEIDDRLRLIESIIDEDEEDGGDVTS